MMRVAVAILGLILLVAVIAPKGALEQEALELRNRGIAELENEQPASAERIFKQLAEVVPKDPLPWANLAIAALRQQRFDDAEKWLDKAEALDGGASGLDAIRAEILQWSGRSDAALQKLRGAADAAPGDPETQYSLYRLAQILDGPEAEAGARESLDRLGKLRPDNLVVIVQLALRARAEGDRAAASA